MHCTPVDAVTYAKLYVQYSVVHCVMSMTRPVVDVVRYAMQWVSK